MSSGDSSDVSIHRRQPATAAAADGHLQFVRTHDRILMHRGAKHAKTRPSHSVIRAILIAHSNPTGMAASRFNLG
jgi:hypothetical protein